MRLMHIMLLILLLLPSIGFCQQLPQAAEQLIPVCCGVTAPEYEFSGIAKWKNYVLLIPQHTLPTDNHHIIAIDTLSIDSVLNKESDTVHSYKKIRFDTSVNDIIHAIQNAAGPYVSYGGFEAAVAIEDSLFFTVETDSLCYVVKGIIKEENNRVCVVFNGKDTTSLPKPNYLYDNAGFESIAYLPGSKQLVALYENNNLHGAATGYLFNTNFSNKQPLHFEKPLLFRLNDISAVKDSAGEDALLGINFFYNDFKKDTGWRTTEFDYYLTGDTNKIYTSKQLSMAAAELGGGNLLKDCFSRIVKLQIRNNAVRWQEVKRLGNQCTNREGILSYKKGTLLVVDGKPPGVTCALSYVALD